MILVDGSITGVPVMPISGLMSVESVSALGMVVTEVAPGRESSGFVVSRNVRCQRIAPLAALMAYRESFCVATKTTEG